MITLMFPFRNRDLNRVKKSLDSLQGQTDMSFQVHFVDYGSNPEIAKEVETTVLKYSFVKYTYHPTNFQPWNKSRALNSIIKNLKSDFCFVADIDMIFHHEFIEKANHLKNSEKVTYFKVGFLDESETAQTKLFNDYKIDFESTFEATGLTLFPVEKLKAVNGFDEFYHFWGSEDTDMHVRLKNLGCEINFYDCKVLLLHQWHQSYRSKESKNLTTSLRLSHIVELNSQHLKFAEANKVTSVNPDVWGEPLNVNDFNLLSEFNGIPIMLNNKKESILHFLFCLLPNVNEKPVQFIVGKDESQDSFKNLLKKNLNKKVPIYYSLKEINDMLLMHIISLYRNYNYFYKIIDSDSSIQLTISKANTVKK